MLDFSKACNLVNHKNCCVSHVVMGLRSGWLFGTLMSKWQQIATVDDAKSEIAQVMSGVP